VTDGIGGARYPQSIHHPELCCESRKTDEYAIVVGYVSLAQWAFRTAWLGRETDALVFVLALCYTGFGTKMSKPCAQITIAIDEPR
jgi:hypothetical protein